VETILVVDDEAEVLAIVREMLEGKGYQILDAPNAEEAVRVSSNYSGPIHLLLTDIVMPGASGHDLAQRLSLQRPAMKILYMSAFTLVMGQQQFSEAESGLKRDAPTILKPFTIERLAEKVKEVLAAKPRSPFDRPPDPWRNV
jgi:two-component system, cell cycle sensor histidine kinase and response regulator CckA